MAVASFVAAGVAIYGQVRNSKAKAKADRANAAYYREQAKLQQMASRREADIFERESDMFMGTKVSIFAKAGIDLSGTSLMKFAQDKAAVTREAVAIKAGAQTRLQLTQMRAQSADAAARDTEGALGAQVLGTGLQAYANYQTFQQKSTLQEQLQSMRTDAILQTDRMTTLPASNPFPGGQSA